MGLAEANGGEVHEPMSDEQVDAGAEEEAPKKKSKGLLFGLIGAVLLGGGVFYGVYSGLVPLPFGEKPAPADDYAGGDGGKADEESVGTASLADPGPTAFVPLEDFVISLGPDARSRHLKLVVSVEVQPDSLSSVTEVTPRIMDVLNTFLRAVDERDFETPRAMIRLRAQMLRRVQLVTPRDSVRDLLIQEFVLN